ncbi:ABC transporter permease [Candidatus Protochlamydia phocaeensis]|uniref:ABC transporter permease n=1 Tax=Candidatus Protochlamydia phocaeensis TaxID=1414722 RepID=UPI0008384936|nr:ABC transporter permease [Candidatus Protochlamydia phocaeensis]
MSKKSLEFNLIIDSSRVQKEYLKDLFRYRELFYFFAWRDILVRYKQTFLGVAWALIRPLLNMAVFAFVFGKVANLASDHINYPLFILAGMLPWQLFASCLIETSNSLVNNAPMISKVYFPRMILPISYILVNFVDFAISLAMLLFLFLVTGSFQHWTILLLPAFIGLTLILCLGTSLWLAAITVRFRDFRFIVPFIVQFGMFISPVGYGSFLVPEPWRWLYFLNPMAGIIEGFRWCCFGAYHADLPAALAISCLVNAVLLVTGFRYFRKMERIFADII